MQTGCVGDRRPGRCQCVLKARVRVFLPGAPGRSGSYHAWRIYWAKRLSAESHLRAEDSVRNTDSPRPSASSSVSRQQTSAAHWPNTALLRGTSLKDNSGHGERSAHFHLSSKFKFLFVVIFFNWRDILIFSVFTFCNVFLDAHESSTFQHKSQIRTAH